jgi:hypothetical protein
VKAQLDTLRRNNTGDQADVSGPVYALLGQAALQIADRKGAISPEEIARLRKLLKER